MSRALAAVARWLLGGPEHPAEWHDPKPRRVPADLDALDRRSGGSSLSQAERTRAVLDTPPAPPYGPNPPWSQWEKQFAAPYDHETEGL